MHIFWDYRLQGVHDRRRASRVRLRPPVKHAHCHPFSRNFSYLELGSADSLGNLPGCGLIRVHYKRHTRRLALVVGPTG